MNDWKQGQNFKFITYVRPYMHAHKHTSVWIYKKVPQKHQVHFDNLTLEMNKKQLKVAS